MGESSGSVSVDMERIFFGGGEEHRVETNHGPLSVAVYGDHDKPALITYPDLALNYMSCFQGLLFCPEASSLLLHHFCIYHINPPGHELGAAPISSDIPVPTVDELADQVTDVLEFFGLSMVMCLGVTAGAYVLTLFAVKHPERVLGLILISPQCRAPSWTEWLYNRVMSNLLYYYGTCGLVKEFLLQRFFCKEVRRSSNAPEPDIVQACRTLLDEKQGVNIWRFLRSLDGRNDIGGMLKGLRCQTLIVVGESSPFHSDALYMTSKLDRRSSALVEVRHCGSLVTEEQPYAMLMPLECFLLGGFGMQRPCPATAQPSFSPRSPPGPSPELLLSPESLGLKLKPIKTRISLQVQPPQADAAN